MSSRGGPRAEGTDGSDYTHREKVADYYTKSAELKTSVRKSIIPHMVLFGGLVMKGFTVVTGGKYFSPLEHWEMVWMISGICAIIGFGALPKNNIERMMIYIVGNLLFGVIPLGWGAVQLVNKVFDDFKDMKNTPKQWKNSPTKMALVAVCFSWQVAGLFHAIRLVRTWRSMGAKKKK